MEYWWSRVVVTLLLGIREELPAALMDALLRFRHWVEFVFLSFVTQDYERLKEGNRNGESEEEEMSGSRSFEKRRRCLWWGGMF